MPPLPCRPLFPLLLLALLLTGCTASVPGGAWVTDPQVRQLFESGTLLANHTY